ncbi:Oligouridylate-binding protein 1-like protein [Drosera capensis]
MLQQQQPMFHPALVAAPQSSYDFVDYYDCRSAGLAIITLNGRNLFGQPIKVNWAYASSQREDTSNHFNIFVGDLSPEVTDATLFACFCVYSSCSFIDFNNNRAAAMQELCGTRRRADRGDLDSSLSAANRQFRCNCGAKGAGASEDKQSSDSQSVVELTNGTSEEGHKKKSNDTAENNSHFTTVYVGNLAPEVASGDLHYHFHALGAGTIEDVRVQRDKGFRFFRYSSHAEAARAIQLGNARMLFSKPLKCSWGSKPTPPRTSSTPLATPAAAQPGLAAAYERQLAGAQVMMHPQPQEQLPLKSTAMAMGAAGASHAAIYDGGLQNAATSQQLMLVTTESCVHALKGD